VAACKRVHYSRNVTGDPAGAEVTIPRTTAEYTVRCVDAAGVPVAFTYACHGTEDHLFHLVAGESYTDDRLALDEDLVLVITSAAGSKVELLLWGA
jgi:hypothetical protein